MQKFSPIRRVAAVASGVAVAALLTTGAATVTASSPQAPIPFPCTGSPLDSATTCALYGHDGSDRGDASGGDTPNLGGGGGGSSLLF